MTTTFVWTVNSMSCYPQLEGQTDVVFSVNWSIEAISDQTHQVTKLGSIVVTEPYVAHANGNQKLTLSSGGSFTPYDQLTQSQVIGWVQAAMGANAVSALESGLEANIQNQINPPVVQPPLPWA